MTMPRYTQVSVDDTPWYHVVCRCVRRAFLCGEDNMTGQNFEHRRGWIEQRIGQLSSVFAIDVAAYAVLSNHFHLVVRVDRQRVNGWSDEEVLRRWTQVFAGPLFVRRYLNASERDQLSDAELKQVGSWVAIYRQRLADLSWYMRVLNETIARKANAEDNCTGRFWEGRFKSQALLDEQAVLMVMSYVDLNPVRAGIVETPEDAVYTSIYKRVTTDGGKDIQTTGKESCEESPQQASKPAAVAHVRCEASLSRLPVAPLLPFDPTASLAASIPLAFVDYMDLIDTLSRVVTEGKAAQLPEHSPPILLRLGIDVEHFLSDSDQLLGSFAHAIGSPWKLIDLAAKRNSRFLHGMAKSRRLYGTQKTAA